MNLTDRQTLAINNCIKKSKIHEKNLMHLIINKFIENNIDISYIEKIKEYILHNVSLTTKFKCLTLEKFIENPILKNRLELNPSDISYCSYRKTKEDTIFHKAYQNCNDSERVKYGSLNLKNLISGDELASIYGDSTIFYKNDIKNRTTFLYGNSDANILYICTYNHFTHLLYHMPISDINTFIDLINQNETKLKFTSYVEIQLHGEINIMKDVEKITMSNNVYQQNKILIDKFIAKYPMIEFIIYS